MNKKILRPIALFLAGVQALTPLLSTAAELVYRVPMPALKVMPALAPDAPVSGGAGEVQVQAAPNLLSFGQVTLGSTSAPLYVEVRNTGAVPATVGALSSTGPFTVGGDCSQKVLAVGQSCFVQVTFSPTALQAYRRNVSVPMADGTPYLTVSVEGAGTNTPPSAASFEVSATSLAFGSINNNSFSKQTIQVFNDGPEALTAPTISTLGGPTYFTATHNCPSTLLPGSSCAVEVTFSPTTRGALSAMLQISASGVSAKYVELTGTSVGPVLGLGATSSLDFGAVPAQTAKTLTATLTNSGDASAALAYGELPAGISVAGCPEILAAGTACTLAITYEPQSSGLLAGRVTVQAAGTLAYLDVSGSSDYVVTFTAPADLAARQGSSATNSFSLQNSASGPLTLSSAPTLASGSYFSVNPGTCTAGLTLQAGASCSGTLTLGGGRAVPTPVGEYTAKISVTLAGQTFSTYGVGTISPTGFITFGGSYGAGIDPAATCYASHNQTYGGQASQYVCNSGAAASYANGTAWCTVCAKYLDDVQFSVSSLDFGELPALESRTQQVSLLNSKETSITVSTVTVQGGAYSAQTNCTGAELASGGECLNTITFAPTTAGAQPGRLTVTANTEGSPFHLPLTGTAAALANTVGTFSVETKPFGSASFTLTPPTSSSAGAWSYSSSDTSVATVSGNTVTVRGVGTSVITATQAAAGAYGAASATADFTVTPAAPTVATWAAILQPLNAVSPTIVAPTSNSPGSWSYVSSDTTVATVSGNVLTLLKEGSTTITATQAATPNYLEATATTTLTVGPAEIAGDNETVLHLPFTSSYNATNGRVGTATGASLVNLGGDGGNALYLPGSSSKLTFAASNDNLFPADFTVESWVRLDGSSSTSNNYIWDFGHNGFRLHRLNGAWNVVTEGNASIYVPSSYANGSTVHVAVSRQGSTLRLFVDGVMLGSTTSSGNVGSSAMPLTLGSYGGGGGYGLNGYLDDFRVTKGVARYTSNFLVPSRPSEAPPVTKVVDWNFTGTAGASVASSSLTVTGTGTAVTPTGAIVYTADGLNGTPGAQFSDANIQVVSPKFDVGSREFAIEWWQKGSSSFMEVMFGTPGQYSPIVLSQYGIYGTSTAGSWTISMGLPVPDNTTSWQHIALVRDGDIFRVYKNGVQFASLQHAAALMPNSTNSLWVGRYSKNFTGIVDKVRVHVGTTPYRGSGSFTPSMNY